MTVAYKSGNGGLAERAANAHEFVRDRVLDADSPMSPKELAREYGCGNQHMQNVCSELTQEDMIERVEEGQYVGADESSESVSGSGVGSLPIEATGSGEASVDDSRDSPESDGVASEGSDAEEMSDRDAALAGGMTAAGAVAPTALERMSVGQLALVLGFLVVAYLILARNGSNSSDGSGGADQQRERSRSAEPSGVFG